MNPLFAFKASPTPYGNDYFRWQEKKIKIKVSQEKESVKEVFDHINSISCEQPQLFITESDDYKGRISILDQWKYGRFVVAIIEQKKDLNKGHYLEASLNFNKKLFSSYPFKNSLSHEIGHFLGLEHSEIASATMFAHSGPGETKKISWADDDINGLCFLYKNETQKPSKKENSACKSGETLKNTDGKGPTFLCYSSSLKSDDSAGCQINLKKNQLNSLNPFVAWLIFCYLLVHLKKVFSKKEP